MEIEDTLNQNLLPINTIAMMNRAIKILEKNRTNNVLNLQGEELLKFQRCLWLVNNQLYTQVGVIDMLAEWYRLSEGLPESLLPPEILITCSPR